MEVPKQTSFPLSTSLKWVLSLVSFFLAAFGQPAWLPINGLIASAVGYALFWRVLLAYPSKKHRFWLGFSWFFCIQLVQASWFLSHPYLYIVSVYLFIAAWLGLQFGIIALLVSPSLFAKDKILSAIGSFLSIAALWAIMEWSRLFLLSGLSWNPVGIAYVSNVYALQMASLWGVYGLSFWVFFVNLLALYAWMKMKLRPSAIWLGAALLPYLYGAAHLHIHEGRQSQDQPPVPRLATVLVQTAFPVEESAFSTHAPLLEHIKHEWRTILEITQKHTNKKVDLIVLPEYVVPFGTYSFVYPLNDVVAAFHEIYQTDDLSFLPAPEYPFAVWQATPQGPTPLVNNAYWVQSLANYFQADVVVGLEDAQEVAPGAIEYYSSAQFTRPQNKADATELFATRYAKRVLVPMGEYIPFSFCQKMAEKYGIFGSFTPGAKAEVMVCNQVPFSPSICYEETYGHLMSEGRKMGANLLVNMTSDVWYPNSRLPRQHLEHARLRTVENGIPLIRACNTGITGAVDSHGRDIAMLGGEHPEKYEWVPDSLFVEVPIHTYPTPYSRFGDWLIIGLSLAILLSYMITRYF